MYLEIFRGNCPALVLLQPWLVTGLMMEAGVLRVQQGEILVAALSEYPIILLYFPYFANCSHTFHL